jgi:hypothetical protein
VALIDTNKTGVLMVGDKEVNLKNYSFSILEDPKVKELREYYKQNLIRQEEFMKLYNCFPVSYVLTPKSTEEDVPYDDVIRSRFEILDI